MQRCLAGHRVEGVLDFNPKWSGGSNDPSCTSCNGPITSDQRSVRLSFPNDPNGYRGFTGLYHEHCGKPFAQFARVLNMLSFRGF
jgi:hypothetical protein